MAQLLARLPMPGPPWKARIACPAPPSSYAKRTPFTVASILGHPRRVCDSQTLADLTRSRVLPLAAGLLLYLFD